MATNYMNLVLPVVGPMGTMGPQWAELVNGALDQIDQHDHSNGKGKQVTPAGININQTLEMNGNTLSEITSLALQNQLSQPPSNNLIYEFGGELFFNDNAGNKVQLTSNGAINVASLGTITGDYSTSSADLTYSDISKTFIFKQDATKTASVDHGPMKIYRNETSSPYTLFQLNAAQSGNISLTLLAALPASTLPIKVSASGVLESNQIVAADIASDAVTTTKILDSNVTTPKINDSAVTTAKIADANVTTAKIADGNVTRPKLVAVGQQISASSGFYSNPTITFTDVTNQSVSLTTTGRPVVVTLQSYYSGADVAVIGGFNTLGGGSVNADFMILRDGTPISRARVSTYGGTSASVTLPPGSIFVLDTPAAGAHTYKLQAAGGDSFTTAVVSVCALVAYEL